MSFSDDSPLSPEEEVSSQPVYEIPPSKYSAERVIKILLQAENSKICRKKPTSVCRSATYVVDVRSLRCQDDIKKDEFGIWNYSGSHPQPFKVHENDDDLIVEKCCVSSLHYTCMCVFGLMSKIQEYYTGTQIFIGQKVKSNCTRIL